MTPRPDTALTDFRTAFIIVFRQSNIKNFRCVPTAEFILCFGNWLILGLKIAGGIDKLCLVLSLDLDRLALTVCRAYGYFHAFDGAVYR